MTDTSQQASELEVLGLLGRGGMAEVYLVRHREQLAALKVLHLSGSQLLGRLEREGRLQARLNHPNVLPVLEEVEFLGRPALLLPYVEGPSLDRLLSEGRLTSAQALSLFRQIVEGVAAIHEAGLVHRDLKPGNVLLDPSSGEGVPRVSDFGLVKSLRDGLFEDAKLTRTGFGMGTPLYAAPEQMLDASRVDARADVWALGCMLVEMLAGRSDEPLPARIPRLPGAWAELAYRLLSPDPAARPADAAMVRALLPPVPPGVGQLSAAMCRAMAPAVLPVAVGASPRREAAPQTIVPPPTAARTVALPEARGRLPAERDDFVGRQSDLAALQEMVDRGARLVTVLGPGGVGKTRLALRWARAHLEDWPGGAWFIDLCEARSEDAIVTAVACALELKLGPADPVRQLGHALAGRGRCLLILDNFEQVSEHAEATVGRWLARAEQARFLVTSRAVLGIAGEQLLALAPFTQADAEALFVRRAQAARRGFSPDADAQQAIAELVSLLDRLPLAIELAAARVRALSPRQIRERLGERFALLSSPGARRGRHAALRATLDWSWELLRPDEQRALAQLSVFEGGFAPEAAEAVLQLPDGTPPWAALQALVDQSLVVVTEVGPGAVRMDLLVSVREYAAEKLGAQTEAAERRHGLYFAQLAERQTRAALRKTSRSWLQDLGNAKAACWRAIRRQDRAVAVGTLQLAWSMIVWGGSLHEASALAEAVLSLPGLEAAERGRALVIAGDAMWTLGRPQARERLEAALACAREAADDEIELWVLGSLGMLYAQSELPDQAQRVLENTIERAIALGDRRAEGVGFAHLGILRERQGRHEEAQAHMETSLARAREVDDPRMEAQVLSNMVILKAARDRYDEAAALSEEVLALVRQLGDRSTEGLCLSNLGGLRKLMEQHDQAAALLQAALPLLREVGNRSVEATTCAGLGEVQLALGQPARAVEVLEIGAAIYRELDIRSAESEALVNLGEAHLRLGRRPQALACAASALEALRAAAPDTAAGHSLRLLAALQLHLGDTAQARARLDEALSLLREGRPPLKGPVHSAIADLGLALAARAELALQEDELALARRLLDEAASLPLGPSSPARAALAWASALLASSEARSSPAGSRPR